MKDRVYYHHGEGWFLRGLVVEHDEVYVGVNPLRSSENQVEGGAWLHGVTSGRRLELGVAEVYDIIRTA